MKEIYVLFQVGVATRTVLGVYDTSKQAAIAGITAKEVDHDAYHSYEIAAFPLNKLLMDRINGIAVVNKDIVNIVNLGHKRLDYTETWYNENEIANHK